LFKASIELNASTGLVQSPLKPRYTPVRISWIVRATHNGSRLSACLARGLNARDLRTEQEPVPSRPHCARALVDYFKSLHYIAHGEPPGIASASSTTEAVVRREWRCVYPYAVHLRGTCSWRLASGEGAVVQKVRPLLQVTHDPECSNFVRWQRHSHLSRRACGGGGSAGPRVRPAVLQRHERELAVGPAKRRAWSVAARST
jgi:hypothetical protein